MNAEAHHLSITRVVDAPRPLVYRAFTDPDDLAAWWGPAGNQLPRDEIDFDVRPATGPGPRQQPAHRTRLQASCSRL